MFIYKMRILILFCILTFVVSKKAFETYKISRSDRPQSPRSLNTSKLIEWKEKNHLQNNSCFIHIPRTGGTSFHKLSDSIDLFVDVWHTAEKPPPSKCGCITNIRDPVKRYISEWKMYGMKYFANNESVFEWFPANGIPKSFDDYVSDTSTHNAITKVLSGYQMFSKYNVDSTDVEKIIKRVTSNCLKIFRTEDMPFCEHEAEYYDYHPSWLEKARKANSVDIELYKRLTALIF